MENIRILHCIQSLSWGGLEIYTADLISQLSKSPIQQWVLCSAQSKIAEHLKGKNLNLIHYTEKKISKLRLSLLIRRVCQENKITHLHSHTRLDMWACGLTKWNQKKPVHIYNLYMNALPKKDLVHKWMFSKIDAVCSSSEFVLKEVQKNWPIDPQKLHLMRYGRDTAAYVSIPVQRAGLSEKYGIKYSETVFGTLCRMDPGKGVKELILALDLLQDDEIKKLHLVLVGDPTILGKSETGETTYESESLNLTKWIDEKSQEMRLKGHVHRVPFQKEFIPFLDLLDVFILASYNETYSLSVLDAMLMQKPVIGTNAGGTTEQIGKNERGYLVPPKDPQKIAEALRYYLRHPEKIPQQGQAAREWVMIEHQWENTILKTLELYNKLAHT